MFEGGAALVAFIALLRLAVAGTLPIPPLAMGGAITACFLWLVFNLTALASSLGLLEELPLPRRHGWWLVVISSVMSMPMLGNFSLLDPWETHYAEVAREILVRDDWLSLWWAQDGFFFSKPVLDFWIQALSFSALGVAVEPGQMIATVAEGKTPRPELSLIHI